ncbi:hypothetical protein JR316_0006513 [Psilocybe cubensis]|uniref:Uncharacterized protein n=2 Tax=Psilocybe cubensis TaxID=181762 RepID=A0A8H8CDX3_PSICU|nr:hypothetical protein JR316_0006513 [Psilocybe cubensis]KAH9481983.1 hypothetical protein JR316_0006513 [Psilocybe cubensis]
MLRREASSLSFSSVLPATNFQDLSALLSLLASDAVEQKLGSKQSYDWERMSSVWSTFGMIGVLRFYLKFAAGLANAERAGVTLSGTEVYTDQRTDTALCYWGVNRPNERITWWASAHESLALMQSYTSESAWLRPIFIAVGSTKCPWSWRSVRCIMEVIAPVLWAFISLAITTIPTIILFTSLHELTDYEIGTLCLQASVSIFSGTIMPILIDRLNGSGIDDLGELYHDRLQNKTAPLIRDGDRVMAQYNIKKEVHIMWQTPRIEGQRQSGDLWWIRVLCAFNCVIVLGGYLGNYVALGNADQNRQYIWLGSQVFILAFRYVLWSRRPFPSPHRPLSLLYIATGSIVDPLPATPPPERVPASSPGKLTLEVVSYAMAAVHSKFANQGSPSNRIRGELLTRMANTVPSDIISVEYVLLDDYFYGKQEYSKMTVLRLSWAFVEECYMAQGVILGPNPWAFGGLFLGAVFLDNDFVGLTTIHPSQLHFDSCADKQCASRHDDYRQGGFTRDGYYVSDLVGGTVVKFVAPSENNVCAWHDSFRDNITRCRSTAKANGPSYIEVHAATSSLRNRNGRTDVSRVEPRLNYDFIQASSLQARTKAHDSCPKNVCEIYTFGDLYLRKGQNKDGRFREFMKVMKPLTRT